MGNKTKQMEKELKRWLKNKIRITEALVVTFLITGGVAFGLPTGENIIAGNVEVIREGNKITIKNSDGSIIDWKNFDTYKDEIVKFLQENSDSRVLNRVTDGKETFFDGLLQSNANVYLINTSGILFGENSRIDTKSLVASSLDISNKDFLDKKDIFAGNNGAKVENQGLIIVKDGKLSLIGNEIKNSGLVKAENGDILLAAGTKVVIQDLKNRGVAYEIEAPNGRVINLGDVIAKNGKIDIRGKNIKIGGNVTTNGQAITIGSRNETTDLKVEKNTNISSSADKNAGDILMWGDKAEYSGKYSATSKDGKGGLIETSGKNIKINSDVKVDTKSQNGKTGTWLIDPINIEITDGSSSGTENSPISKSTITNNTIVENLKSSNVTITTDSTGADEGKIDVNANIIADGTNVNDLKLVSNSDINIKGTTGNNRVIDMKGGALNLEVGKHLNISDAEITVGKDSTWNVNKYNRDENGENVGGTLNLGGKIVSTKGNITANVRQGVFDTKLQMHSNGTLTIDSDDLKSKLNKVYHFKRDNTYIMVNNGDINFSTRATNNTDKPVAVKNIVIAGDVTVAGKGNVTFNAGKTEGIGYISEGIEFTKNEDPLLLKTEGNANLRFYVNNSSQGRYKFNTKNLILDTAIGTTVDIFTKNARYVYINNREKYDFDSIIHKGKGTGSINFGEEISKLGVGRLTNEEGIFNLTVDQLVSQKNVDKAIYAGVTEQEMQDAWLENGGKLSGAANPVADWWGVRADEPAKDYVVDKKVGDLKETVITNTAGTFNLNANTKLNANTVTNTSEIMNINTGNMMANKVLNVTGNTNITAGKVLDLENDMKTDSTIDIQSGSAAIKVTSNNEKASMKIGGNINIGQDSKLEMTVDNNGNYTNAEEAFVLKNNLDVTNKGLFAMAATTLKGSLNMNNHNLTIEGGTNILKFNGYYNDVDNSNLQGILNQGSFNFNDGITYMNLISGKSNGNPGFTTLKDVKINDTNLFITSGALFGEKLINDTYQAELNKYVNETFHSTNYVGYLVLGGNITATRTSNIDMRTYSLMTGNTEGVNIVNDGDAGNTFKLQAKSIDTSNGKLTLDKWGTPNIAITNLNKGKDAAEFEVKGIDGNEFTLNVLDTKETGGVDTSAGAIDGTIKVANKDSSDVNISVIATKNTPLDFNANITTGGNITATSGKNIITRGELVSKNGNISINGTKVEKKEGNYSANNVTLTSTEGEVILNTKTGEVDKIEAKENLKVNAASGLKVNGGELSGKTVDLTATAGNISIGTSTIKSENTDGVINITAQAGNINVNSDSTIGDTAGEKADVNIISKTGTVTTAGTTLDGKNITVKGEQGTTVSGNITASKDLTIGEKATTTINADKLTAGETLTITAEKELNIEKELSGKNVTITSTGADVNIKFNAKINCDEHTTSGTIAITGKNVTVDSRDVGNYDVRDDIVIKAVGTEVDKSAPDDMSKNKGIATISADLYGKNVTVDGVNKTVISLTTIEATESITLGGKDKDGIRGEVELSNSYDKTFTAGKDINLYTSNDITLNSIKLESTGNGTISIEGSKNVTLGDTYSIDTKLSTNNGKIYINAGENLVIKNDTSIYNDNDEELKSSLEFIGKDITIEYEPNIETNDITIKGSGDVLFNAATTANGDVDISGKNVKIGKKIKAVAAHDKEGKVTIKGEENTRVKANVTAKANIDISGKNITTAGDLEGKDVTIGDNATTTTVEGDITATNATIKATDRTTVKNNTVTVDSITISGKDVVLGDNGYLGREPNGTERNIDTKFIVSKSMKLAGTDSVSIWKDVVVGDAKKSANLDIDITSKKIDSEGIMIARNVTLTGVGNEDDANTSIVKFGGKVSATGDIKATGNDVTASGEIKTTGANNGKEEATGNITIVGTNSTNSTATISTGKGNVNIGADENGAVVSKNTTVSGDVTSTTGNVTLKGSTSVSYTDGTLTGAGVKLEGGTVSVGNDGEEPVTTITGTNADKKVEITGTDITVGKDTGITSTGTTEVKGSETVTTDGSVSGDKGVSVAGETVTTTGKVESTTGTTTVFGKASTTTSGEVKGNTGVNIGTDGKDKSGTTTVSGNVTSGAGKVTIIGENDVTIKNGTVSGKGVDVESTTGAVTLGDGTGANDTTIKSTDATSGINVTAKTNLNVKSDAKLGDDAIKSDITLKGDAITSEGALDGKSVTVGDENTASTTVNGTVTGTGDVKVTGETVTTTGKVESTTGTTTVFGKTSTTTSGEVKGNTGVNIGTDGQGLKSGSTTVNGNVTSGAGKVTIIGENDVTVKNGTVSGKGVDVESTTGAVTLGDGTGTNDTTIKSTDATSGINVTAKTNLNVKSDAKLGDDAIKSDITLKGDAITSEGALDGKSVTVESTTTADIGGTVTGTGDVKVTGETVTTTGKLESTAGTTTVFGKTSTTTNGEVKGNTGVNIGTDGQGLKSGSTTVNGNVTSGAGKVTITGENDVIVDGGKVSGKGVDISSEAGNVLIGNGSDGVDTTIETTGNSDITISAGGSTTVGKDSNLHSTGNISITGDKVVSSGDIRGNGTVDLAGSNIKIDGNITGENIDLSAKNEMTIENNKITGDDITISSDKIIIGDGKGKIDTLINANNNMAISGKNVLINSDSNLYSNNAMSVDANDLTISGGKLTGENIDINQNLVGKGNIMITDANGNRGNITANSQLTIGKDKNTNLDMINSDITSGVDKGFTTNLDGVNIFNRDDSSTVDGKVKEKNTGKDIFSNIIDTMKDIKEKEFIRGVVRLEKVNSNGKIEVKKFEKKKKDSESGKVEVEKAF